MSDLKQSHDSVLLEIKGHVGWLTLNRPQALNALNASVLDALEAHVCALRATEGLRVVVLTGAGKAFVAGADIKAMADLSPQSAAAFAARGHRVFQALSDLPVPVLAAVNGFCLGGGCELALSCDVIYASDKAKFGQPEVKLGLIPGFGGTQRLARKIGPMAAGALLFSGGMIDAAEAKRLGLCLEVYSPEALIEAVTAKAEEIAAQAPLAVAQAKALLKLGLEAPLATANAFEAQAFGVIFDSQDAKEGVDAFINKRAATFNGR
ncbi:enoyl-CoA hydratase/isomerase family protein [Myxococcota bacterium]|nr:enoyl-CoA hydratase/isomerase family protein [Myxococcota bacterium]MBU1430840.1 enoyl-CoA hydratase/isomerase family protein [Myxococcota bacterium]MBU1897353.1 enoyl-CoA hydratase/isomerase family protein [Myxococcota bacterium]